jgi:hypothetical protein
VVGLENGVALVYVGAKLVFVLLVFVLVTRGDLYECVIFAPVFEGLKVQMLWTLGVAKRTDEGPVGLVPRRRDDWLLMTRCVTTT